MSSNPIIPPSQEVPADVDNVNLHQLPNDCDHDAAVGDESDYPQEVSPSPTFHLANKRNQPAKKPKIGTALVIQEQITKIARFDHDPNFIATIPERYNKYAVPQAARDGSTSAVNAPTMDAIRDELAISLSIAWN
jgi:hypothetical protein